MTITLSKLKSYYLPTCRKVWTMDWAGASLPIDFMRSTAKSSILRKFSRVFISEKFADAPYHRLVDGI